MRDNNKLTVFDVVKRLEKQNWDRVEKFWCPTGKDSIDSVIYASKTIGDYELSLTLLGVGSDDCLIIKLMLSKNLSLEDTASILIVYKEDLEQKTEMILSELEKADEVLEIFERKCPKEPCKVELEELAEMLNVK